MQASPPSVLGDWEGNPGVLLPPPATNPAARGRGGHRPPPSLPASRRRAMRAPWLLLLALPGCPRCCRCPGGAPPVLPPTSSRNETLARGGQPRAPDVAVLVAMGGWLGAILVYVGRYVRRSRAESRLHLEYLQALPCKPPSPEEEEEEGEEETPSSEAPWARAVTSSEPGSPEGVKRPQTCPSGWSGFIPSYF